MLRLAWMLYGIVAMTLSGSGVVAVLVLGATQFLPILAAAAAGAIVALPVTLYLAGRLLR